MATLTGSARRALLTPAPSEVLFETRGFHVGASEAQVALEGVGRTFLEGFRFAIAGDPLTRVEHQLAQVERDVRGFAFEGAAMAVTLTDGLAPWGHGRFRAFIEGPALRHPFMAHVGAGWAMARLPRSRWRTVIPGDPLLRWLALDGYGFHQAYFRTQRYVSGRHGVTPLRQWPHCPAYVPRAVDQGIGRALWFVAGADVQEVVNLLRRFPEARRADLWSGVGLAATYAGSATRQQLEWLMGQVEGFRPELAQGAAFAAKARLLAGLVTDHTLEAAEVFCKRSVEEVATLCERAMQDLPADGEVPAYEAWRYRIQDELR